MFKFWIFIVIVFWSLWFYQLLFLLLGWVKSFAIFSNMRHNSTALDAFGKVVKVTNHTRLCDTKLTWYSPSATWRMASKSTVLRPPDLAWSLKFLHPLQNFSKHLVAQRWSTVPSPFAQQIFFGPVGWGGRIHWLYLSRRLRLHQFDGEALVMLKLWGIWSTPIIAIAPWFTQAQSGITW